MLPDQGSQRGCEGDQVVLQAVVPAIANLGNLPAIEYLRGHDPLELLQVRHMFVKRHVTDCECTRDSDKGDVGQAHLRAGLGDAFAGDGAWTAACRWRGLNGHGMVLV